MSSMQRRTGIVMLLIAVAMLLALVFLPQINQLTGYATLDQEHKILIEKNMVTAVNLTSYLPGFERTYLATSASNLQVEIKKDLLVITPDKGFVGERLISVYAAAEEVEELKFRVEVQGKSQSIVQVLEEEQEEEPEPEPEPEPAPEPPAPEEEQEIPAISFTLPAGQTLIVDLSQYFTEIEGNQYFATGGLNLIIDIEEDIMNITPYPGFAGEQQVTVTSAGDQFEEKLFIITVPGEAEEDEEEIDEEDEAEEEDEEVGEDEEEKTEEEEETEEPASEEIKAGEITLENKTLGKKIEDEPSFEVNFTDITKDNETLTLIFYHDSDNDEKIYVDGDVNYTLSRNLAEPYENITLIVMLDDGIVPEFELHVGETSEKFKFGKKLPKIFLKGKQIKKFKKKMLEKLKKKFGKKFRKWLKNQTGYEIIDRDDELVDVRIQKENASVYIKGVNATDVNGLFEWISSSVLTTEIFAADPIDMEEAVITLPRTGNVNSILKCPDFDLATQTCPSAWQITNLPFSKTDTHINFTVDHFSGYGGGPDATWGQNLSSVYTYGAGAWGDLDNDGDMDLVQIGFSGAARIGKVYMNNGTTLIEDDSSDITGVNYGSIALGDVDNDGDRDAVITGLDGSFALIKVYINNGSGVLNNESSWSDNMSGVYYGSIDLGDLNRDGLLDLILTGSASGQNFAQVYINNGTKFKDDNTWSQHISTDGLLYSSVVLADFTDDGYLDAVMCGRNESFQIVTKFLLNNGTTLNKDDAWGATLDAVYSCSLIAGDVNNDGATDLFLTGYEGKARIYINNGTSLERTASWFTNIGGVLNSEQAFGDVDNDGDLDLVVIGDVTGANVLNTTIYLNNGTTFNNAGPAWNQNVTEAKAGSVTFVDVNNDKKLDLHLTGYGYANTSDFCNTTDTCNDDPANPGWGWCEDAGFWGNCKNGGAICTPKNDWSSQCPAECTNSLVSPCSADSDCWVCDSSGASCSSGQDLSCWTAGPVNLIYLSSTATANTQPNASGSLNVSLSGDILNLSWSAGADAETPASGLYYNLRIGTSSASNDVFSGFFGGSAHSTNSYLGNMMQRKNLALNVSGITGVFFASVQTVDTGLEKSDWSLEENSNQPPTQSQPILNSTSGGNNSDENLTVYPQNINDPEGASVTNITNWYVNGTSFTVLNSPFDKQDELNSKDYSGYDNDGTVNDAGWTSNGISGGAYSFNGVNDYILVPDSPSLSPRQEVTVEGWFYYKNAGSNTGLIWKHSYNYILYTGENSQVKFRVWNTSNAVSGANFSEASLAIPGWNHIVGVFNGTNAILYLNGSQIGTIGSAIGGGIRDQAGDLFIGKRGDNGGSIYFNGTIDEVRIYNQSLTPQQIKANYNAGAPNYRKIASQETAVGEVWQACLTPNDRYNDGTTNCSNNLTVLRGMSCGDTITANSTLSADLTTSADCLTMGADDITIDCAGNRIIGNNTGTGIVSAGHTGITITNCIFINFTNDILFDNTNDSVIASTDVIINITNSNGNNVTDSNITELYVTDSTNIQIINCTTANYTLDNVTVFTVEDLTYGSIRFLKSITANGTIMDADISILKNKAFVNSSGHTGLNVSANITLKGLPFASTPNIFADRNDDGQYEEQCVAPVCSNLSYAAGTFVFNVSYFTSYTSNTSMPPIQGTPILNSTFGTNRSHENLTVHPQNVQSPMSPSVKNITNWYLDGGAIAVLNMPFEGGSNSTYTKDYSGGNRDGIVGNAVWSNSSGYDGWGSYSFDGSTANITLTGNLGLDLQYDMSIAAWINLSDLSGSKPIVVKQTTIMMQKSPYSFGVTDANLSFSYTSGFLGGGTIISPAVFNQTDKWYFVAVTRDYVGNKLGGNSTIKLFVDGQLVKTGLLTGFPEGGGAAKIGTDALGTAFFNGSIDEVWIFNRTLSDEQILSFYQNGPDTIVSQETNPTEVWQACLTPNDRLQDGATKCSNNLTIRWGPPTISQVILNSSSGNNLTADNITAYPIVQPYPSPIKNITSWNKDGTPVMVLNTPFEGGSNSTWTRDYSGWGNNGTVSGAVWNDTGGYDGWGAYNFPTNNDYINCGNDPSLNIKGPITVSAWIKPTANLGTYKRIVTKDWAQSYVLNSNSGTNGIAFCMDSDGNPGNYVSTANNVIPLNSWTHVVGTWDGFELRIYLNGRLNASKSHIVSVTGSANNVMIGKYGGGVGNSFPGLIDEVRIYNYSLSEEQVLALYNNRTDLIVSQELYNDDVWQACVTPNNRTIDGATKCSNNLTLHNYPPTQDSPILNSTFGTNLTSENITVYPQNLSDADPVKSITSWNKDGNPVMVLNMPFDGGSNSTWTRDYSGWGNNGTVTGALWSSTRGYDGWGAYYFPQTTDEINCGNAANLNIKGPITVSAWIKPTSTLSQFQRIVEKDWAQSYYLGGKSGANSRGIAFGMDTDTNTANFVQTANNVIPTNAWTHVVGTWDGSELKIYINGTLNASKSYSVAVTGSANPVRIGKYGGGAANSFPGWIDEVRIYNSSLSDEQILALYNNRTDLIVSEETAKDDVWQACLTPNDRVQDGVTKCSNNLTIIDNPPTQDTPILNSTTGTDDVNDNLTVYPQNVSDPEGQPVKNITVWRKNNNDLMLIYVPFEVSANPYDATDYAGFDNNAIGLNLNPVFSPTSGHDGWGAYTFSVNDDAVNLNTTNFPSLAASDEYTVEAWIKTSSAKNYNCIFAVNSFDPGWYINGGNILRIYDGAILDCSIPAAVNDNKWHHVAWARDGSGANQVRCYVDGASAGTATHNAAFPAINNLRIGWDGFAGEDFEGIIDEFKFWNTSLSVAQIKAIYDNRTDLIVSEETSRGDVWQACLTPNDRVQDGVTKCSNNLTVLRATPILNSTFGTNGTDENLTVYAQDSVGAITNITNWYHNGTSITVLNMPFDTNSSSNVRDYTPYQNNGTIFGTPNWTSSGVSGGAYVFNGSGDYIRVLSDNTLNLSKDLSVEVWVKPRSYAGPILVKGDGIGPKYNYYLQALSNRKVRFWVYPPAGIGTFTVTSVSNLTLNQWTHIAATYDNSTRNMSIYFNGTLDNSAIRSAANPPTMNTNLYIGRTPDNIIGPHFYFNGTIDEVRIYNRTLSAQQIRQNYNNGAPKYDVITSDETKVADTWQACVTPNNAVADSPTVCSNNLTIAPYPNCPGSQYTGILTIDSNYVTTRNIICKAITINNSAILKVNSYGAGNKSILIQAENITIATGSVINGTGLGYPAASGPGAGVSGVFQGSGGGHGGDGGLGNTNSWYGLSFNPTTPGSGGGSTNNANAPGGPGGAAIKINATNNLIINGSIVTDGIDARQTYFALNGYASGGGAGGSIWITADYLTGFGNLSAKGGAGILQPNSGRRGGGGGGGRIAVYYNTTTWNMSRFNSANVSGGPEAAYPGKVGTAIFMDPNDAAYIPWGFKWQNQETSKFNFTNLTIYDASMLTNMTPASTTAKVNVSTTCTITNSVWENLNYSLYIDPLDLFVINTIINQTPQNATNMITLNATRIFIQNNSRIIGNANITAVNITMDSTSIIDASEFGYSRDNGPGVGAISGAGWHGGGGGYGGKGGGSLGGNIYSSSFQPITFGSGGRSTGALASQGGHGGGLISIIASNVLNLNGNLISDGGNATGFVANPQISGGGSGGGIYISAYNLTGFANLTARGGGTKNALGVNQPGSGGGGGRIAVFYNTTSWTINDFLKADVSGGIPVTAAGVGSIGEIGTVAFIDRPNDVVDIVKGFQFQTNDETIGYLNRTTFNITNALARYNNSVTATATNSFNLINSTLANTNATASINAPVVSFDSDSVINMTGRLDVAYANFSDIGATYINGLGLTIEKINFAEIAWLPALNNIFNLSTQVQFGNISAFVNSSAVAGLNQSANITFFGVSFFVPYPLVDLNDNGTFVACPGSICTEISHVGTTYTFNTTRFSNFTLGENYTYPNQTNPVLQSSAGANSTYENLTVYPQNVTGQPDVTNITDWFVNNQSLMVLKMPFNINNATTAKDYSPFANNGAVNGSVWTAAGISGGAYIYDGIDDGISVPADNSLNLSENFSVEVWIKPRKLGGAGTQYILDKGDASGVGVNPGHNYALFINSFTNRTVFGIHGTGAYPPGAAYWVATVTTLKPDQWYHIVGTFVNSTHDMRIYLNGSFEANQTSNWAFGPPNYPYPLTIGRQSLGNFNLFNGTIDEVRIYNRTLTPEQIKANYNKGHPNYNTIVSQETRVNETWRACVALADAVTDTPELCSNNITIKQYLPITCGTALQSNKKYAVFNDLVSAGNCWDVSNLANITINCQGHKVTGPAATNTLLYANGLATNIVLKHCFVQDFQYGVNDDFTSSLFYNNTFNSTRTRAIALSASVNNVTSNTIMNADTTSTYGVFINNVNRIKVYSNNFTNIPGYDLYVRGANHEVKHNYFNKNNNGNRRVIYFLAGTSAIVENNTMVNVGTSWGYYLANINTPVSLRKTNLVDGKNATNYFMYNRTDEIVQRLNNDGSVRVLNLAELVIYACDNLTINNSNFTNHPATELTVRLYETNNTVFSSNLVSGDTTPFTMTSGRDNIIDGNQIHSTSTALNTYALKIDGSAANSTIRNNNISQGRRVVETAGTLSNVTFYNNTIKNVGDNQAYGVYFNGGSVTFANNSITCTQTSSNGLATAGTSTAWISNNTVNSCRYGFRFLNGGNDVHNNTFINPAYFGIYLGGPGNSLYRNNITRGNIVNGNPVQYYWREPCPDVNGQTINVSHTTETGFTLVDMNNCLVDNATFIGVGGAFLNDEAGLSLINSNNSNVTNNNFTNLYTGIGFMKRDEPAEKLYMANNYFASTTTNPRGIYYSASSNQVAYKKNHTIYNNTFIGMYEAIFRGAYTGHYSVDLNITGNLFNGSTLYDIYFPGRVCNVTIESNRFDNFTGTYSIYWNNVNQPTDILIKNNTFTNGGAASTYITVGNLLESVITENYFNGSQYAIYFPNTVHANNTIYNNEIYEANTAGIYVGDLDYQGIFNNTICYNKAGIVFANGATYSTVGFHNNSFCIRNLNPVNGSNITDSTPLLSYNATNLFNYTTSTCTAVIDGINSGTNLTMLPDGSNQTLQVNRTLAQGNHTLNFTCLDMFDNKAAPNQIIFFLRGGALSVSTTYPDISVLNFKTDRQSFEGRFETLKGNCTNCSYDSENVCQLEQEVITGGAGPYNMSLFLNGSAVSMQKMQLVCTMYDYAVNVLGGPNCTGSNDNSSACANWVGGGTNYTIDLTNSSNFNTSVLLGNISPTNNCSTVVCYMQGEWVPGDNQSFSINKQFTVYDATNNATNPNGTLTFTTDKYVGIETLASDINILNMQLDFQNFNGTFDSTTGACTNCSFDGGNIGWCQVEVEKVFGMFQSYNLTINLTMPTPINMTNLQLVCRSFNETVAINSNCSGLSPHADSATGCFSPVATPGKSSVVGNTLYINLTGFTNLSIPMGTISPTGSCKQVACELTGTWGVGDPTQQFVINKSITVSAI
ncbi:VCBS repeat-containing protein [Candidatus Woesearchaeota archaeon]|nr:VCBS repeat-containing protein [Candidatus Woesearchaeota archaeon]